ncbi:hypothetical protein HZC34_07810 [Candidatus Saganbacteria bacterium]|nr:hypothetical protein [Candidatus Saganbacteria bacterium]
MNNSNLIILESLDEAKRFINVLCVKDNRLLNSIIISLTPNIRYYLKKNGVGSVNTSEIIDERSFNEIMDKSCELEDYIREYAKNSAYEMPEEYFLSAYFHYLRQIWRYFLFNIELIGKSLDVKKPQRIYSFKYKKVISCSPWIDRAQLYIGDIAEQICRNNGIEFVGFASQDMQIENEFKLHGTNSPYHKLCDQISYCIFSIATYIMSKKKTLLVSNFSYNMNLVCAGLSAKSKDIKICQYYLGSSGALEILRAIKQLYNASFKKKNKKGSSSYHSDFALSVQTYAKYFEKLYDNGIAKRYLETTLKNIKTLGHVGIYKGVDIAGLLHQKVETDLIPYMLRIHFQAFGLKMGIQALKPNYVVSQMNFGINGALGEACRELGLPSVLISHGSHVLHEDKYSAREHQILAKNILVGDYKYLAVQSPYARDLALKMTNAPEKIVCIKPLLWGRTKIPPHRTNPSQLTIVHAGTFKLRHNRRYIYETSDEFLQSLIDLCEVVSGLPHLKLIIKIRPDIFELPFDAIKMFLPSSSNIVIETQAPFLDVLKIANLLVSFSSTTIEEALNNNIPVLLYGGGGRYAHIPTNPFSDSNEKIEQAVTFAKNKESLKKYLTMLDQKHSSLKISEIEFKKHCFGNTEAVDFSDWFLKLSHCKMEGK